MRKKLFVPFVALLVLALTVVGSKALFANPTEVEADDSAIVKITSQTYDTETAKGVVLVDFWASWCGPCRKMNPILETVAKDQKGVAKIGKVNVDDNKELAQKLSIVSIPTIIVYKDGKEVDRIVGVVPQEHLEKAIKHYSTEDKK